jgi:deazaflavin-dependent oxidoreductase (nitroreductase family)
MRTVQRATRLVSHLHAAVFRLTGGRVGGRLGHMEQVLLTTTGRRTGRPRTVPLAATPVGEDVVLIASDGGAPTHPAWFLNLTADPDVLVRRGDATVPMRARVATGDERRVLWARALQTYAGYDGYQRRAPREIPVVVCEPVRDDAPS